jgi:alanine dehydrogenase
VQAGAWCLLKQNGGSGVLLPGLDGVAPGKVVILGAGNVGSNALAVAHGMGCQVTVFAQTEHRFAALRRRYPRAEFHVGSASEAILDADLVIGGVLTPGRMSPKLIDRSLLRAMREGSALVDVGIDQGGIAETSRPTSHSAPTYVEEGVVHYCVPNMPAACARTASLALERAVLPFVLMIMKGEMNADLASGIQVKAEKVTHEHLARDTGRAYFGL